VCVCVCVCVFSGERRSAEREEISHDERAGCVVSGAEQLLLGGLSEGDQWEPWDEAERRGDRGEGLHGVPLLHCSRPVPGIVDAFAIRDPGSGSRCCVFLTVLLC
jgi:hypothetical protein